MTASINGAPFTATLGAAGTLNNGLLAIAGTDATQSFGFGLALNRGLATYRISLDDTAALVANLTQPPGGWSAFLLNGSGTLTLTALSATNAAGTFSFTLLAVPGTAASGDKVITNGTFNVPLTAPPPVPRGLVRGTISALVDGVPWRGASDAFPQIVPGGVISITGIDTDGRLITMALAASGPGTYSLDYINPSNAMMVIGANHWFTMMPGGAGSVTFTTFSPDRVTGTFQMTMQPSQANVTVRPAIVTNGQFDLNF